MVDKNTSPILVALDYDTIESARALVKKLDPALCRLKIGKNMFTRFGPDFVRELQQQGFDVFLDLKFHDIPATVASAVRAAAELGVWMVNVHVQGGRDMLRAAVDALKTFPKDKRPLLIGVTILTSLNSDDLAAMDLHESVETLALRYAVIAKECGLDGVVCSAHEAAAIRQQCGKEFVLVTPGIRLENDNKGDQKRVMTPDEAIRAGSNYLVIGRSITTAEKPVDVLKSIVESLYLL